MSPVTRRALSLAGSAALVATLVGCSDDSSASDVERSPSARESQEPQEDEVPGSPVQEPVEQTDEPTEEVEGSGDGPETFSATDLAGQVAAFMDDETGTEFPVECDGELDAVVDAEQRCWRLIDGLADEGIPDGSRLGITVTITQVTEQGPSFYVQADDAVSPPED